MGYRQMQSLLSEHMSLSDSLLLLPIHQLYSLMRLFVHSDVNRSTSPHLSHRDHTSKKAAGQHPASKKTAEGLAQQSALGKP